MNILLRYVEEEIKDLAQDRRLFFQIYDNHFRDAARKGDVTAALAELRDASLQRLVALSALTEKGDSMARRRAALSSVADAHLFNAALSAGDDAARSIEAKYDERAREYLAEVQSFIRDVCRRKGIFPG